MKLMNLFESPYTDSPCPIYLSDISFSTYLRIINTIPQPIMILNSSAFIEFTNHAFVISCRTLGIEDHLLDKHMKEAFPFIDKSVINDINYVFSSHDRISREYIFTLNQGTLIVKALMVPLYAETSVCRIVIFITDISQQKHAELLLARKNKQLLSLVENIPVGIYRTTPGPDGKWLFANGTMIRMLGVASFEELKETSVSALYDRPENRILFSEMITKQGYVRDYELRWKRKDGTLLWGSITAKFVSDDSVTGEKAFFDCTMKDITERKHAEQSLRESEERFRRYIDSAPEGVYVTDFNGRFADFNPAFLRITGYSKDELSLMSVFDLIPPVSKAGLHASFKQISSKGKLRGEYPFIRKDGSYRWASLNAVTLNQNRFLGFVIDITAQREMEQAIRESEERYRILFTSAIDAIFIKDRSFRYRHINQATAKLLGLPAQEIIGKSADEIFGTDMGRPINKIDSRVITGEVFKGPEVIMSNDGIVRHVDMVKTPMRDFSGRIIGICGIARDVTEIKMLEEQLRHAQKAEAIGTLAGGIAHDFNNILGGIIGYAELALGETPYPGEKFHYYLSRILEAGNRAKSLVQQILQFSRPGTGTFGSLELKPLIKEAIKLIKATLPSTISVKERILAHHDNVQAEPGQIHQVIMNLVTNAHQSMNGLNGVLSITLEDSTVTQTKHFQNCEIEPGEYVKLSVSDTGRGISPSIMHRIFEPYFTTKEIGEGSGLGLSVVSGIIKNHHGFIEVDSTVGHGTVFSVFLPRSDIPHNLPCEYSHDIPRGNGEQILIVDDETFFLDVLKRHLTGLGYKVTALLNSIEALNLFKKDPGDFDIIITDQTMPHMTGVQLSHEIRLIDSTIPIIICTGFSETLSEHSITHCGISTLLMKPVYLNDLAKSVKDLLKRVG